MHQSMTFVRIHVTPGARVSTSTAALRVKIYAVSRSPFLSGPRTCGHAGRTRHGENRVSRRPPHPVACQSPVEVAIAEPLRFEMISFKSDECIAWFDVARGQIKQRPVRRATMAGRREVNELI